MHGTSKLAACKGRLLSEGRQTSSKLHHLYQTCQIGCKGRQASLMLPWALSICIRLPADRQRDTRLEAALVQLPCTMKGMLVEDNRHPQTMPVCAIKSACVSRSCLQASRIAHDSSTCALGYLQTGTELPTLRLISCSCSRS